MKSVMPCTSACAAARRPAAARQASFGAVVLGGALGASRRLDQALAGDRGAAVQHHVLDALAQLGLEVVVDADHAGVDDAHVHAGLDRVVQEHGVDRLAHRSLPRKLKLTLRDAAATLAPGRFCLIQRVASMKSTA
jgi:hypothetical protein